MAETNLYEVDTSRLEGDEADFLQEAQTSLAGFKQLYLRWLSPVYRYFYFRTANPKDAEDLTSQVFLKVYEKLPQYREHGQFPAWLFTIVRNQAADFFRSERPEISLETVDPVDDARDVLSQTVRSAEIQQLYRLIRSLPEEEQDLIRLRFVAELGYREIGAVLDRKEDAVRKSITRLLARMKDQMEASHE